MNYNDVQNLSDLENEKKALLEENDYIEKTIRTCRNYEQVEEFHRDLRDNNFKINELQRQIDELKKQNEYTSSRRIH